MEFTKHNTSIAKGVSICLMFIHHLYAFNYRLLSNNNYIPFIPGFSTESYIANFGSICVSIFLFLSGYGLFLGWTKSQDSSLKYSWKKIKDFYLTYWTYFLIFVPIGLIFFQKETIWNSNQIRYSRDPVIFLMNFLGLYSNYNEEWWFVHIFVIILAFLCPIYLKLAKKYYIYIVLISFLMFALDFKFNPYKNPFNFAVWQPSFALGIICARLNFFSSNYIRYLDTLKWYFIVFGIFSCIVIDLISKSVIGIRLEFLIVPIFIYFSVRIVKIIYLDDFFAYLGKYSFPLWLIHSFFCYYYLQDVIYFPKWSPFIFLLLTIISLMSVLAIEKAKILITKSIINTDKL